MTLGKNISSTEKETLTTSDISVAMDTTSSPKHRGEVTTTTSTPNNTTGPTQQQIQTQPSPHQQNSASARERADRENSPPAGDVKTSAPSSVLSSSQLPSPSAGLGSKTTLLSARSQIEILNPNEPQENGTFDSKKSPLALLAATCNNIGKDCGSLGANQPQPPNQHQNSGYAFFTSSLPANVAKSTSGRTLSCSSPVSEIKLTSPLGVQHVANKLRLPTETDSLGNLLNVPPVSVCPTSVAKSQISTPPSMLKYMDKLSPIAASNEYAQLQAKFASALSNSTSATGAPMPTSLGDIYDPFKLAAAIQQAKTAAAAAYMFPGSNPLSALSSLTSGASALSAAAAGVNTSLSTNPISTTNTPSSNNSSQSNTTCHLCPTSQFIVGGGHSPPKPGAGSPYITFVPVKTASSGTALVPVCADRGCLNCIAAIRQAQLATNSSNCSHCTSEQQNKTLAAAALAAQHNLSAAATGNPLAGVGGLNTPSSGSTFPFLPASLQAALQQPSSLAAVYQQLAAANAAAAAATLENNSGNAAGTNATSGTTIPTDASNNRTNSPSKLAAVNQDLHKCKWAPAGGGQPCGKSFASPEELMDHIKVAHMMTQSSPSVVSTANSGTSPGSQQLLTNNSPTSVASAIEEVSTLQQLVNNRRLSPSSVTQPHTGAAGGVTSSMLSSLQNLSAASNPLASLSSLSRKIPGTVDLASAISAAARYHPYSKFSLPTSASGLSNAPSVGSLAATAPPTGLSGLNPASLNALLSNAAASSFLMYDLPKA